MEDFMCKPIRDFDGKEKLTHIAIATVTHDCKLVTLSAAVTESESTPSIRIQNSAALWDQCCVFSLCITGTREFTPKKTTT